MKDGKLNGVLTDETNSKYLNASAEFCNGKLYIYIEGYGDACSVDGKGEPVVVDYFNKKLQVVVWSDINQEDPTDLIDLEGAKESNRAMVSQDDD